MARDYFSYSVVRPDATVNSTGDSFLTSLKDVEWEVEKINSVGTPVPGITVYLSRTGNDPVSNFVTGANGVIEFWAEPGEYIVRITDPASRIGTKEIVWNSLPAQDGAIPGTVISSESGEQLVGSQITDTTITANDIASNAVTTAKIQDDAVTSAKIATNAVGADALSPDVAIPVGAIMPYGGSTAPNAQWVLCDGSTISRTTYSALFGVIGTTYGSGNGSSTFHVPDLRGRMPIGAGTGAGDNTTGSGQVTGGDALTARTVGQWGGNQTHTLTEAQIPGHTHSGTTGGQSQNHEHSGTTYGMNSNTSHSHSVNPTGGINSGTTIGVAQTGTSNATDGEGSLIDPKNIDHTHSFGTSSANRDHTHSFTTGSGSGGGGSHNNVQPFLVTNYIMRAF